jgi:hypothetical protein
MVIGLSSLSIPTYSYYSFDLNPSIPQYANAGRFARIAGERGRRYSVNNYLTVSRVLVLVALICFILAALSVSIAGVAGLTLVAAGLAFWAASQLVP